MKFRSFCLAAGLSLALATIVRGDTFTVSNANESGAGSMRQAINDNNAAGGGNTIVFDSSFNQPRAIGVSAAAGGELKIDKNVTIVGPGAKLLQIDGLNGSRVFNVGSG